MKSKMTKFAVTAVMVISFLIPLTYGTATIIKDLIVGSVWIDDFEDAFKLNDNITVDLSVGIKKEPRIVSAGNIRFFHEDGTLRVTLRCNVSSWPKFKWQTTVELLSANGERLGFAQSIRENGGVKPGGDSGEFQCALHFALGKSDDTFQSQTRTFSVRFEQVPEETTTTPKTWVESNILKVVHGRVMGEDGLGIPNAIVQIRELRVTGQLSISAANVVTDNQGYYCYDEINWPYRVGVAVYRQDASGQGYYLQYKRLNEVLKATKHADFNFEEFPRGTAILKGRVVGHNKDAVREFTLDIRNKVDWKNYSGRYLHQFGFKKPFATSEGNFEIRDLPSGEYQISITPTVDKLNAAEKVTKIRRYVCELAEGTITELTDENAMDRTWYGRVLFKDGNPAIVNGATTQIIKWTKGFPNGQTIATVGNDGYFMAYLSDEVMGQLKTGKKWLTLSVSSRNDIFHEVQKEKFPAELLTVDRDKAGTVIIARPKTYYGQILYENSTPAVPQTPPWKGAGVYASLRYTPGNCQAGGGLTEYLGDVDAQGHFAVLLNTEQLEKIRSGKCIVDIIHPSYEEEYYSYPICRFPPKALSTKRNKVVAYKLPYEEMHPEFRNLKQQLESACQLEKLGRAISAYRLKYGGNFPMSLDKLKSFSEPDALYWLSENVEYLGSGRREHESEVIAYDKSLLDRANGTNVLFYNGYVEFCRPKRLKAIGIEAKTGINKCKIK